MPDWARQPQQESSIPGWINVVIALAAIIPILYLLLRDTKVKPFLKPTEFQDLPLQSKQVSELLIPCVACCVQASILSCSEWSHWLK